MSLLTEEEIRANARRFGPQTIIQEILFLQKHAKIWGFQTPTDAMRFRVMTDMIFDEDYTLEPDVIYAGASYEKIKEKVENWKKSVLQRGYQYPSANSEMPMQRAG